MRESEDTVDRTGEPLVRLTSDALGGVVHAADGVDDPDLVARANAATSIAAVTVEGRDGRIAPRIGSTTAARVAVLDVVRERGAQVVRVHPRAGSDRLSRDTDRVAVLHYNCVGSDGSKRHLVSGCDGFGYDDFHVARDYLFSRRERVKGDRNVIRWMNADDTRSRLAARCFGRKLLVGPSELHEGIAHHDQKR